MTFSYKGDIAAGGYLYGRPFLVSGEHAAYTNIARSGFLREYGSKAALRKTLDSLGQESALLPAGTVLTIGKVYHPSRGYEPGAPFRSGEEAEVESIMLVKHATWYDPKTGKASPAKWATIGRSARKSGRDPWTESGKAAKHERGENPRISRQLAATYSKPKAGTSWAKATLAERRTAYRLAYPGRDVGGWDLGFADAKAAKFLKVARYAKAHPRDPLSKRIRAVLGRGSES